jgi:hypothetical protein
MGAYFPRGGRFGFGLGTAINSTCKTDISRQGAKPPRQVSYINSSRMNIYGCPLYHRAREMQGAFLATP